MSAEPPVRLPDRSIVLQVRAEPNPCIVCNKPIAPGQLYAIDGPKHITCGVYREHPRPFGIWWGI